MSSNENSHHSDRLGSLLGMLSRVSAAVGAIIETRAAQVAAVERRELRHAVNMMALTMLAAAFGCAAAGFAATAVLVAVDEAHRAAAAAAIAGSFALLALIAVLMARGRARPR